MTLTGVSNLVIMQALSEFLFTHAQYMIAPHIEWEALKCTLEGVLIAHVAHLEGEK